MLVSEAIPPENTPGQPRNYGLSSPTLQTLVGSLSHAAEDSRYFLNGMNKHAAGKDDKLLMFQDDLIAEKWPEILEHRNVSVCLSSYACCRLLSLCLDDICVTIGTNTSAIEHCRDRDGACDPFDRHQETLA